MDNVSQLAQPPSATHVLFWKNLRVVVPYSLVCWGCFAAVQLAHFFQWLLRSESMESFATSDSALGGISFFAPFVASALVVLVSAAMLVGHERQQKTWDWTSSLPVTWQASLFSKFGVTMLVGCAAGLTLVPWAVFFSTLLPNSTPGSFLSMLAVFTFVLTIVLAFSCLVFFLFLLLFREPMHALLIGLITSFVGVYAVAVFSSIYNGAEHALPSIPLFTVMMLVGTGLTLAMVAQVYRRVWSHPHHSILSNGLGLPGFAMVPRAVPRAVPVVRKAGQPSEYWCMFRLALQSSLVLRAILCVALLTFFCLSSVSSTMGLPSFLFVAASLIGATTFAEANQHSRVRFLTDRGVNVLPFLTTYLAVGMVWLVGIACLASAIHYLNFPQVGNPNLLQTIGLSAAFFFAGALCSIVNEKTIVSITFSLLLLVAAGMTYVIFMELVSAEYAGEFVQRSLYLSWPILLVAVFGIGGRWLVRKESRLVAYMLISLIAAVILPTIAALV